jgi:hypothetical protein
VTGVVLDGFPDTVRAAAVHAIDGDRIARARMLMEGRRVSAAGASATERTFHGWS